MSAGKRAAARRRSIAPEHLPAKRGGPLDGRWSGQDDRRSTGVPTTGRIPPARPLWIVERATPPGVAASWREQACRRTAPQSRRRVGLSSCARDDHDRPMTTLTALARPRVLLRPGPMRRGFLFGFLATLLLGLLVIAGASAAMAISHADRVMPGVSVAGIPIGGIGSRRRDRDAWRQGSRHSMTGTLDAAGRRGGAHVPGRRPQSLVRPRGHRRRGLRRRTQRQSARGWRDPAADAGPPNGRRQRRRGPGPGSRGSDRLGGGRRLRPPGGRRVGELPQEGWLRGRSRGRGRHRRRRGPEPGTQRGAGRPPAAMSRSTSRWRTRIRQSARATPWRRPSPPTG